VSQNLYENLLRDIIKEINIIAEDISGADDTDFDRGYRAGMMVVMKAIQDELSAFGASGIGSLGLIDVDRWFKGEE
jgi:hypothetical protein